MSNDERNGHVEVLFLSSGPVVRGIPLLLYALRGEGVSSVLDNSIACYTHTQKEKRGGGVQIACENACIRN